ncbi:MAG: cytochrome c maturation protein CcmE [Bacteroidetes bacterium]|nr:cytochrome c maturation protein CcmE [Bacteroidota bacterium]
MKTTHIIGLVLIAVAISVIIGMVGDASSYETFATASSEDGREFHVVGYLVQEDEMHYDPEVNPDYFSFYIKDKAENVKKVVFHDSKPRDFERSEEIVLTGRMKGDEFHASKILLKCPSKYVEDELTVDDDSKSLMEFKADS